MEDPEWMHQLKTPINCAKYIPVHLRSLWSSSDAMKHCGVPSHSFDSSNNCNTSIDSLTWQPKYPSSRLRKNISFFGPTPPVFFDDWPYICEKVYYISQRLIGVIIIIQNKGHAQRKCEGQTRRIGLGSTFTSDSCHLYLIAGAVII